MVLIQILDKKKPGPVVERCFNITFMSIGDNSMYSCELEYLNWSVWLYAAHYVVFCNDNLRCDELLGPGTLVLVNWTQTRFSFLIFLFLLEEDIYNYNYVFYI